MKGGSDTTIKLMDDSCTLRVPKFHLNTETAAATYWKASVAASKATNRRMIDGMVPERVEFGAYLPTKTPRKLEGNGNLPTEMQEMIHTYTGMPMKSHQNVRQRCFTCKMKTSWHCVGYKRWFCTERKVMKNGEAGASDKMNLYVHEIKGKSVIFQKSCYHAAHQSVWDKQRLLPQTS